jgi:ligand-binding SRPBCC domain-containing protein
MSLIDISLVIAAPIERCFDLSRSIDLHLDSMSHTDERAVAGVVSGLIGAGEEVTWEARHFGVTHRMTSRITAFQSPSYFQDSMTHGPFAYFVHDHHFRPVAGGTLVQDHLTFGSPLGLLGRLADRLVLVPYLRRLLERRADSVKRAAESLTEFPMRTVPGSSPATSTSRPGDSALC